MKRREWLWATAVLCSLAALAYTQSFEPHTPPQTGILNFEVRHYKIETNGLSTPMAFRLWSSGQVDWTIFLMGEWTPWSAIGED